MYRYYLTSEHKVFVALIALIISLIAMKYGSIQPSKIRRNRLNNTTAIILVVLFCLLLNIIIGYTYGLPVPVIHDEFAYLLSADTFAKGRLTNPPHAMWEHFQTFHVFFSPTYQAKYPPGQGAFLALGQVVAHMPIIGVWISLALACGACCWMFQAILPVRWAVMASMLIIFNPFLIRCWGQTYWGGAAAMLGGALYFGGFFRFSQRIRLKDTLRMAVGAIIMANSRPFEGFVLCILSAPFLIFQMIRWKKNGQGRHVVLFFIIPFAISGFLLAGWILYYNYCLSGDMFKFYYYNWKSVHATIPLIQTFTGSPYRSPLNEIRRVYYFFIGPVLAFTVLGVHTLAKKKQITIAMLLFVSLTVISIIQSKAWPHYLAPAVCLLYAGVAWILHALLDLKINGRPWGRFLVSMCLAVYFIRSLFYFGFEPYFKPDSGWMLARDQIQKILIQQPGNDLILVRYAQNHVAHWEWVYNEADIDGSEVVWARDLGPDKNRQLTAYYRDRKIWLVLGDEDPPQLYQYQSGKFEPYLYYDDRTIQKYAYFRIGY